MADDDENETDRLTPIRPLQLVRASVEAMIEAEKALGQLGDKLHELRHEVARMREKLEVLLQ